MSSADGARGLCPLDSRAYAASTKGARPPLWTPTMRCIVYIACGRDEDGILHKIIQHKMYIITKTIFLLLAGFMKMRIDFCQDKRIIRYVKKQNSLDAVSVPKSWRCFYYEKQVFLF